MKQILVEEVFQLAGPASLSVPDDTSLKEIVDRFAHQPSIRAIFLVDSKQRFCGMLRRVDLAKWLYLKLFGKTGGGKASTGEAIRFALAEKAKDLARGDSESMGVHPEDTLQEAMNQMIFHGEAIIPVVDKDGKILGDLRISEVLLKALELEET